MNGPGPSGEIPTRPQGRRDPATGYVLPAQIAGYPLPSNFNSARHTTWPVGLTRNDVTAWVFAQAERPEPPVPSPATQPVAPSPEAPVDTQGNVASIEYLASINAKLDRLLRHLGLLREDWQP